MIKSKIVQITDSRLRLVREGHLLLTSLEGENPGGSIKDHMVEGELLLLWARGKIKRGDAISEISSGSTARSLAYYSKVFGLKCVLFVPVGLDTEKQEQLRALGAELHFVDPISGYEEYSAFLAKTKMKSFNQFGNRALASHYGSLSQQVMHSVDHVVGTVGTGHSLVGVADGFGSNLSPISAEPIAPNLVPGIRNVKLEHFGENDPCQTDRLTRIEVRSPIDVLEIETDAGVVEVHPSFSYVLTATDSIAIAKAEKTKVLFLVGADTKRMAS